MRGTLANAAVMMVGLAGSASCAFGQQAIEWSKDGRAWAYPDGVGEGVISAELPVPFGGAGWSLELRLQVGAVRVGDLNGDGLNDLFVGCFISNSSPPYTEWQDMIFYNTGDALVPLGATPDWVSADEVHTGDAQLGDLNGDGSLDVVAISGGFAFSPPRVYYGPASGPGGPSTSPGWISTPPRTGWATSGTLFDIDGDDDLDLLTTNQGVAGVVPSDAWRAMYFFRNNGSGLETSPSWASAEISIQNTAAAFDYDGDGDEDIAVAKWVNFESSIYRNNAGTLETTPAWGIGSSGADRGVTTGDVDGNGDSDMMIGVGSTGSKLYANEDGVLSPVYNANPPFKGQQEIVLVDFDNDGDLDFAEVHFSDGKTHLYVNTGGVLSTVPDWTFDAAEVGNAIAFGDLNGDGWKDLAVGYSGNTSVRVFFASPIAPTCPADLTGDDFVDDADFVIFAQAYEAFSVPPAIAAADFTGDAFVDDADFVIFAQAYGAFTCP